MIIGKDEMVLLFTLIIIISKVALYGRVRFEAIMAIVMKGTVFWDIMPCSPLEGCLHFRGTCQLPLED
jgi:hypothetical protein